MTLTKTIMPKLNKFDECYTRPEIIYPLIPFIKQKGFKTIWCPFDKRGSNYVKIFKEAGFKVIYSHIEYWQDFLEYEPEDEYDVIISNPPFSNKRYYFERAIKLWKPFALLSPAWWLNDKAPYELFKNIGLQLIIPNKRVHFDNCMKWNNPPFKSIYYCRNFLIWKDIVFISLQR